MSKKILSVMLALVLVLSTFAVSAFAAVGVGHEEEDAETGIIENTQVWSLEAAEEADANGYYAVTVSLKTNYDAVGAISFVLNVEGATLGDYVCNIDATADIVADGESGLVNIYPMPASAGVSAYDFTAGAAVATLYYKLNDGVNSATITLNNDAKCNENPDGKLFAVRTSDGKLAGSAIYGQRVVDAEGADIALDEEIASVTIGAAMLPAELALTATGTTNGVVIDGKKFVSKGYAGVVYGFPGTNFMANTYITNNVAATNGGSLKITRPDGKTTGGFGTGSTIEVLNSDGSSTGKVYVVVIFGDVDCNGMINGQDAQATLNIVADATLAPNNSIKRMAANCQYLTNANMMHNLNGQDAQAILNHVANTARISQSKYASLQNSYNTYYQ